jgi:hypothetical protein
VAGKLKKCCGNFFRRQSAPPSGTNRESVIPAILGEAMIADILRKTGNSLEFASSR